MKKTLAIILSILIVITTIIAPVYAFAPPSKGNSGGYDWLDKQYGKWTKDLRDPKTGVLKSGVEVTAKSSKGLVSKIIKNPSTLRTAKFLAGGIGYALIDTAIKEMLNATDFVLDPANNTIRYTQKETVTDYLCKAHGGDYVDPQSACNSFSNPKNSKHITLIESRAYFKNDTYYCYNKKKYFRTINIYDVAMTCKHIESDAQQDKEMTLDELAELIKQQAEAGNKTAQDLLTEVVKEMGEAGELDTELDAADEPAIQPDAETGQCQKGFKKLGEYCYPETDTEKPEPQPQPFELPAFCEWTGLCETWKKTETNTEKTADNTEEIKEDTKTIREKISELFDWLTEKSEEDVKADEDTQVDIDDKQPTKNPSEFDKDYLNYGGQCPTNPSKTLSIGAQSVDLTLNLKPMCDFALSVRPAVIALAYLSAMAIVANAIRDT